jgi:hypothetical protein
MSAGVHRLLLAETEPAILTRGPNKYDHIFFSVLKYM